MRKQNNKDRNPSRSGMPGAEPKDYEIQEFVSKNYYNLKFSTSVPVTIKRDVVNPKRKLRETRKQSQISGIGTKSQQALQLQREENKLERKVISREFKVRSRILLRAARQLC